MLPAGLGILFVILLPVTGSQAQVFQDDDSAPFIVAGPIGDFNATGSISSLILNQTADERSILAGSWKLLVSRSNVTGFEADFTTVTSSGADRHVHGISRFEPNAVAPVILDVHGTTFTGLTDISTDGNVTWHNVQTTVTIARQDVIRIAFDSGSTDDHFAGQPIYGVVYGIQKYDPQCCS